MKVSSTIAATALALVLLAACGREETKEQSDRSDSTSTTETRALLVTAEGVGPFRLYDDIPKKFDDTRLKLTRTLVLVEGEGEQYEEPWYVLTQEGTEVLRILPAYDPDTEDFSTDIGEIRIESGLCMTKDGIRVGNTLEQLAGVYKSLTFWYSYVSDNFVAEVPELPGVQFLLDGNGFVGARDDLEDSDIVFLARPDFRPNTTIRVIRVLGEM
ncbi:MAG: hypothetical protein M5R41_15790 [Bacteroidia bacterium]|nr:hypothetical protein [Bacteroidia bacterium]